MHEVDKKEAAKRAKNEYQGEWRSKNWGKVRQYNRKYWAKQYEKQNSRVRGK